MRHFVRVLCCLLLISQTNQSNAAELAQGAASVPGQFVLEDGTPVKLRISQTVSSADAHVDDKVEFEVLEEVRVADVVVIPKGGIAWGTVTEAQPKRRMARGGKLEIVMDSVRLVDGQKAALRAVKNAKGGGHAGAMTAGIVATGLLFWPAAPFFLFMHGKDITIPKGAEVPTFVNGNFNLTSARFKQAAQSAMVSEQAGVVTAVAVNSSPSGADIQVDGNFVGNTPSTVNVQSGKHSIAVKKAGFRDWGRDMVFSGGTITLSAELVAGSTPAPAEPAKKQFTVTGVTPPAPAATSPAVAVEDSPGWIGISTKRAFGGGVQIVSVSANGPASKGGLKAGDIITELNGITVNDQDFDAQIIQHKPGSTIRIGYMRNAWAFETTLTVSKESM